MLYESQFNAEQYKGVPQKSILSWMLKLYKKRVKCKQESYIYPLCIPNNHYCYYYRPHEMLFGCIPLHLSLEGFWTLISRKLEHFLQTILALQAYECVYMCTEQNGVWSKGWTRSTLKDKDSRTLPHLTLSWYATWHCSRIWKEHSNNTLD